MLKRLLLSLLLAACTPLLAEPVIHEFEDLQQVGERAAEGNAPLLVMFSMDFCGYCVRMEEEYLKPMLRSGDYADKVVIGKLKIDRFAPLRDFDGSEVEAEELARRYGIKVTPTLALIAPDGRLLGERLEGIGVADFRWAELDRAIDRALMTLRSTAQR